MKILKYAITVLVVSFIGNSLSAQIKGNQAYSGSAIPVSSAFIDASVTNSVSNVNWGKGFIFPRADLSQLTLANQGTLYNASNNPNRFDGMIVYNTATSGTVPAASGTTQGTLTPGFWYYQNSSTSVNGGTWKPLGGGGSSSVHGTEWYLNDGSRADADSNKSVVVARDSDIILNSIRVGGGPAPANISSLNAVLGAGALANDVSTGTSNVGGNVAVGYKALSGAVSSYNNVAIGSGALSAVSSGHDNIGIGGNTGNTITTSSGNILIGNGVQPLSNSASTIYGPGYSLNIGGFLFGANMAGDGNTSSTATFGINTGGVVPAATLQVAGSFAVTNSVTGTGPAGSTFPATNTSTYTLTANDFMLNVATTTTSLTITDISTSPVGRIIAVLNSNTASSLSVTIGGITSLIGPNTCGLFIRLSATKWLKIG